jgi:hypothetical protein
MRLYIRRPAWFALWAGVAFLSTALAAYAQSKDSIIGTWVLDRGKSEFAPDNPNLFSRTMIFEAIDNGFNCIIRTESTRRDMSETKYTARYDGKDAPIDVSVLDTVSLRRVDANTVERTGQIRGKAVETAVMKVSADGKTLTVTTKGSFDGENYNSTQVFDRK